MPIEKQPANPVPVDYTPGSWRGLHRVRDNDTWESVAKKWRVNVQKLVCFNFNLTYPYDPAEVNWYLRRNVGCKLPTRDGKNWRFSSDAEPGWLFIPPVSANFPYHKRTKATVQDPFRPLPDADGTLVPLPYGHAQPGDVVYIMGDEGHGYAVSINRPSGIVVSIKRVLGLGGLGVGNAAAKKLAERAGAKALVRFGAGVMGGQLMGATVGGAAGVFIPTKLGKEYGLDEVTPEGVYVHYSVFD
jgi:hypothetical protein